MHLFFSSTLSYLSNHRERFRFDRQEARSCAFRPRDSKHAMQVQVETFMDDGGAEKLRRFYLNGRQIEVAENIDQWHGADYRYFKVRGSDGNVYILYLDELRTEWALTMYQRSHSRDTPDAM